MQHQPTGLKARGTPTRETVGPDHPQSKFQRQDGDSEIQ